jgi:hypothetical protein
VAEEPSSGPFVDAVVVGLPNPPPLLLLRGAARAAYAEGTGINKTTSNSQKTMPQIRHPPILMVWGCCADR